MEEKKKPENPHAFPVLDPNGSYWQEGMTLRDYFAAKAMQGTQMGFDQRSIDEQARLAYKIADAMLKQRNQ